MTLALVLLVFGVPALVAVSLSLVDRPVIARRWAIAAAGATLASTSAMLVHVIAIGPARHVLDLAGLRVWFAFDGASAVTAVVAALVTFGALVFTPRRALDPRTSRWVLMGEAGTMLAIVAESPALLVAGWALGMSPLLVARTGDAASRLARAGTVVSTTLLAVVFVLDWMTELGAGALGAWSSGALIAAVLARAGVPPLHGWAPVALHRAPVASVLPALITPLPILVLARAVIERGAEVPWLPVVLIAIGVVGTVYGALLAMVQHEIRRAVGYVYVSATSSVVAAIGSSSAAGLAGALLASTTACIALSGLMLLASAIGARTGTCDMRRLGGLSRAMPLAGAIFLLCSVAAVGFPGTIGFVSEDLVMQGLLPSHPIAALIVLAAAAVNGVTLFRMFKRTFLGPSMERDPRVAKIEDLLPRERLAAMAWAVLLIIGGFAPAPLVAIRAGLTRPTADLRATADFRATAEQAPSHGTGVLSEGTGPRPAGSRARRASR